jgi:hypothetical protein
MPLAATTNPRRLVFIVLLSVCGGLNIFLLGKLLLPGTPFTNDFMAFWSYPRFAAGHSAQLIYDAPCLQVFQLALYPGFHGFYPFRYPPPLLLAIWWLKFLPFGAAKLLWSVAGLLLLAASVPLLFPRHRWIVLASLLASPATLANATTGQTAFFTTAMALAGFGLLRQKPILAGMAFGLLTLKPQLGVLIPFFLLARGDWRAIAAACVTAGGLCLLSSLLLPPGMWRLWFHILAPAINPAALNFNMIITPAANLIVLGVPQRLAWAMQALCGFGAAAVVVWLARRAAYNFAVAAVLVGTFLAQPHAEVYDSVLIIAAMALCVTPRLPVWALALGVTVYAAPLALLTPYSRQFLYAVPLMLLLAAIVWLARGGGDGAKLPHAPATPAL